MSMLARYKKTGGFVQLLALIEGFGQQKREKFLEMIDQENPTWSKALKDKMLSVERIMGWPDQVVIEIFKSLPIKNMAVAIAGLKPEQLPKIMQFFTPSDKRKMDDALAGETPKPEEISSSLVKVIEITRKMIKEGELRPDKFDMGLVIPEEFEASLESAHAANPAGAGLASSAPIGSSEPTAGGTVLNFDLKAKAPDGLDPKAMQDYANLQKLASQLAKDNKILRDENKVFKEKLEQIRKIA